MNSKGTSGILATISDPTSQQEKNQNFFLGPLETHIIETNRLQGMVAHAFNFNLCPPQWAVYHQEASLRISAFFKELDSISAKLHQAGVAVILIENGALARIYYPCAGCFSFGDLEVVVERKNLNRVHEVLISEGYSDGTGNFPQWPSTKHGRVEYERILPSGLFRLNVQWSLVARRWFNGEGEPNFQELLSNSVEAPNSKVRILNPTYNLFQLTIHNASHAYVRKPGIRLHIDIDRLIRHANVDWNAFLELTNRFQRRTAAYFSLSIPLGFFETPVPKSLLESICPPKWKRTKVLELLKLSNIFETGQQKFTRVGFLLFSSLMYDSFRGLVSAVFPNADYMRRSYQFSNPIWLPFFYLRRLKTLIFQRA